MRLTEVLLAIAVVSLTSATSHADPNRNPPFKLPSRASLVPQDCPTDNYPSVDAIAFLANSPILVAKGEGKQLNVWNIQTGRLVKEIPDVLPGGIIAASPTGSFAAIPSDGAIKLLDINTGQILRTLSQQSPHQETTALAFNSTGRLLLSSEVDMSGAPATATAIPAAVVSVWDTLTGQKIRTLGSQPDVSTVAFSPDGKLGLAAGQYIRVWDVATGALIQEFNTHNSDFGNELIAVFSPDGTYVISGGHTSMTGEPALTLWSLKTGQIIKTVDAKAPNRPVAFSADKRYLLSVQGHDRLELRDVSDWSLKKTFSYGDGSYGYFNYSSNTRFAPDGVSIATISSACSVQIWRIDTGGLLETLTSLKDGWVSYSPDGWFVSSGNPGGQLKLLRGNRSLDTKSLIQKNQLDTLAAVNGVPSMSPPGNCRDSNFPLGQLICDDGRLGRRPSQISDASAYFSVVQTAQSAAEAQRGVTGLMVRFPYERFSVFPPYTDESKWMIVMASYADADHAQDARELALRLGIASNPYVWKIPNPANVPKDWTSQNIQQVIMQCLASGMQTVLQMYTCSGSIVTPALLQSCITDGGSELNLTPLAATQFLDSQNISWNSPLVVQANVSDLAKTVQTCLNAKPKDAEEFTACAAQATLGADPVAACGEQAQDDHALSNCLLKAAGMNGTQIDCLLQRSRGDPSKCVDTTNAPQWLKATQCLSQHNDPYEAVQSCLLTGVDPNAVKLAKCLSANHAKAANSLACAAEWPALGDQVKIVQCFHGLHNGENSLLKCGEAAGIHLDPTVSACLQSPTADAVHAAAGCLSGVNNPAVACFANFAQSNDDVMTCLANRNAAARDALAAVRCITSENDASDLIASCTEGLVKDPKARQALACAARSGGEIAQLAGCAAAPVLGGEAGRLLTCATQSQSYAGLALCAAGPKMNQEWMIAAQCAASSGGVPMTTAACTAGWLTIREWGKCLEKGFGGDGCFGPDNTIVKAVANAIHDITKGPGPNNEIVKAMREIGERTQIKDVSLRTPLGGRNAFIPKAGRDFDQAKKKIGKYLGARLGIH